MSAAARDMLSQRNPGPAAIQKGLASLLAGLNARHPGQRWRVSSPPDGLEGSGPMGAGNVDGARVVGPDQQNPVGNLRTARAAPDEDVPNKAVEKVA